MGERYHPPHAAVHAVRHGPGESDPLKLDDLAPPDDNTDLNATTARHGLLRKLSNIVSQYMDGTGEWSAPPGGGAPTDADYLVGTTNGSLSAEIVVGTTPGGELGGTWAAPTVDVTHSGSAHHTRGHTVTETLDHTFPGGTTTFLRADGTFATPAGGGDSSRTSFRRTGVWHAPDESYTNTIGSGPTTANMMYAVPIYFAQAKTVIAMLIRINSASTTGGAVVRLGIYTDNGSYYPGVLLLDAGTVACDSTGDKTITSLSAALAANTLYWLVLHSDGSASQSSPVFANGTLPNFLGAANSFGGVVTHIVVTRTYGALPDPFTAGGTYTVGSGSVRYRVHVQF